MQSQSIDDFQDPFTKWTCIFLFLFRLQIKQVSISIWPVEAPLFGPDKPIVSGTAHFH